MLTLHMFPKQHLLNKIAQVVPELPHLYLNFSTSYCIRRSGLPRKLKDFDREAMSHALQHKNLVWNASSDR